MASETIRWRPTARDGDARLSFYRNACQCVAERGSLLDKHRGLLISVLVLEAAVLAAATVLYFTLQDASVFEEGGLVATADFAQLLMGGIAGIFVFVAFRTLPPADRASAFWGFTGLGLFVLAFDDYLMLHESAGRQLFNRFGPLPLMTNNVDDFIVLSCGVAGLLLLVIYRREVMAARESNVLLLLGIVFAGLMLMTDVYAHALWLKALEYPAQGLGSGLLMLACVVRLLEVSACRSLARGEQVELDNQKKHQATPQVGADHVAGPVRPGVDPL
jgi:hypothetical protein